MLVPTQGPGLSIICRQEEAAFCTLAGDNRDALVIRVGWAIVEINDIELSDQPRSRGRGQVGNRKNVDPRVVINVETAGRAVKLQARSVGATRQVLADELKVAAITVQVEDVDSAPILMSYEHQPLHTLRAGVRIAVLVDKARGNERRIRYEGNALGARATVERQEAAGVPIVIQGRRPVNGDVELLNALFTLDHKVNDILRKIRLSDALEIAEVRPLAAIPATGVDPEAAVIIFDHGP